jgi:vanillate O-demethylase ferredoxin subunit
VTGGGKAGERLRRSWPKPASIHLHSAWGICGICLTGRLEENPYHRDFVLTDEERAANNQMILCRSRAKSPVLLLDL